MYRTVPVSLKCYLEGQRFTFTLATLAARDPSRVSLSQDEVPTRWYNIQADLTEPLPPPLDPGTKQPVNPASLERIFAKELIRQEISSEQNIAIPETVRDAYIQIGRPTPLVRARRLERFLKTPAKIFYKAEYLSPTGSHKPNTALAQAYYNSQQGTQRLVTESGAGQWGQRSLLLPLSST
jgi:tryptophan synthase beta chain